MFNHNRGLWGYTGTAADGAPLTIQATGIGGPSAAIVLEELIAMGVTRAIRVGTAAALDPRLALGALVVADAAICDDGASRALGAGERAGGDPALTAALAAAGPCRLGTVATSDLFYARGAARVASWRAAGACAVEMAAAALFTVGRRRGVAVACALAITEGPDDGRPGGDAEALRAAAVAAGRLGAAALR